AALREADAVFTAQLATRDREGGDRSARLAELERSLTAAQAAIATLQRESADKDRRVAALEGSLRDAETSIAFLRVANLKLVTLASAGPQPPDARAHVFCDMDRHMWRVVATGLMPVKPGRAFELWYILPDDRKIAAGMLAVDDHGDADQVFTLPPGLDVAVAAVTDEPMGGVQVPTGEIHLAGKMK
ncbi:MAG: anti-sigma factor, partial [Planctomycetes bacterium]|nr:anti-sigma factor [Planctomycetota bacterium]